MSSRLVGLGLNNTNGWDQRAFRVVLSDGERIAAGTIIHSGGLEARRLPLSRACRRDELGRLVTDAFLRVEAAKGLFAAGDAARAAVDEAGRPAPLSCQHAIPMGDRAGRNAAAQLLGLPLQPYRQPSYVTCLDLGVAGALFTVGWERRVVFTGGQAKFIKRQINASIPPAAGSADTILSALEASLAGTDDLAHRLSQLPGAASRLAA